MEKTIHKLFGFLANKIKVGLLTSNNKFFICIMSPRPNSPTQTSGERTLRKYNNLIFGPF